MLDIYRKRWLHECPAAIKTLPVKLCNQLYGLLTHLELYDLTARGRVCYVIFDDGYCYSTHRYRIDSR
jgi:hypothetical protein